MPKELSKEHYEKLWMFLHSEFIRIQITVDTTNPGIEGHPIAVAWFLDYLERNLK